MQKLLTAYILGIISFLFALAGIFSFFFSVPGLFLAISSLKLPEKKIHIPIGYEGRLGNKKLSARPYVTSRYLAYIAVVLNIFSMAVAAFATFSVIALFVAGTR